LPTKYGLRNLGGIIVVDFIDMERLEHREQVYSSFCEEMKKDPVKTQVYPMSPLGLVELTRKRTRESLSKALTCPCLRVTGGVTLNQKKRLLIEFLELVKRI
jgi:ribonuclease G